MQFNSVNFQTLALIFMSSTFFYLSALNGQQIENVEGKKYQYEGQIYKYAEMDQIFRQNEFSYNEFQKVIQKRKTAKTLGFISLGGLGAFFVSGALSSDESFDGLNRSLTILGLTAAVFVVAGTAALVIKSGSKKLEKRSVDIFNQQVSELENESSTSISAQFGLLSNGRMGFVFSF